MDKTVDLIAIAVAALAVIVPTSLEPRPAASEDNGIYIAGALHALHETEESFSYRDLSDLIEAVDPDVMLLEVRPDELSERKDTPGRPEYPAVVWPMLDESGRTAVAMEPADPLFTEMVTGALERAAAFERDQPEKHALLTNYRSSLNAVLGTYWSTLERTHDRITYDLTRASYIVSAELAGAPAADGQRRWDDYMVDQVRRAIRANPERKILVLGSYRNRHYFLDELRPDFNDRLIDMEDWIRRRDRR
jgi:hypothetical protein